MEAPLPPLGSAVLARTQKEQAPFPIYFLSVNSDCVKVKLNRLSSIIINKAGLLSIFRVNTIAFRLAYRCFGNTFLF